MSIQRPSRARVKSFYSILCSFKIVIFSLNILISDAWESEQKIAFSKDVYTASIYENHEPHQYIHTDDKMGLNLFGHRQLGRHVRFKIVDGDKSGFFKAEKLVVGDFCFLRVRTRTSHGDQLNRERQSSFRLRVRALVRRRVLLGAAAGGGGDRRPLPQLRAFAHVQVHVLDRNDLSPWFESTVYRVRVGRDAAVHSNVVRVHADDADDGVNGEVYYSLDNDRTDPNQYFAIHPVTGQITVLRSLVNNQLEKLRLDVFAVDRGAPHDLERAGRAKVLVDVVPVNLHAPVVTLTKVNELVDGKHVYAKVYVRDADSGRHGEIDVVRLIDKNADSSRFAVRSGGSSGEFLIYDKGSSSISANIYGYNLTLNVSDRGIPQRYTLNDLQIKIDHTNTIVPQFSTSSYKVSVGENLLNRSFIVTLLLQDEISDSMEVENIRYDILQGNENQTFSLDQKSGIITTNKKLDAEEQNVYFLSVSARNTVYNSGGAISTVEVEIHIEDENDNIPVFGTPNTQARVNENEAAGLYVTRVEANDRDQGENGMVTFSLLNEGSVPFTIDSGDGTIRTAELLDYESQRRRHVLRVRASDWGHPYRWHSETTVTVNVQNVNDNRPQFEKVNCRLRVSHQAAIGSELMVLSAVDLDQEFGVVYRIVSGNRNQCFRLEESSGSLKIACALVGSIGTTYKLSVLAYDGEHFSDKTTVTISIVDNISTSGETIVMSECEDTNAVANYRSVVSQSEKNNREDAQYTILTNFAANYFTPEITNAETTVKIEENSKIGTKLLDVSVSDNDSGFSGTTVFTLSHGNLALFNIDPGSGSVSVVGHLDYEQQSNHVLNITVCDLGLVRLCSWKSFTVSVIDINDNPPIFEQTSYVISVPESSAENGSLLQLVAHDIDEDVNSVVNYRLETHTVLFSLNSTTGVLAQSGTLDRELQSRYTLIVSATDSGSDVSLRSTSTVTVLVEDINDNAPVFSQSGYKCRVLEDVPVGTVVATVEASDPDRPDMQEPIEYFLVTIDDSEDVATGGNHFSVDRFTGAVRVAQPLDYEQRQFFNLSVEARDRSQPILSTVTYLLVYVADVNENLHRPTFSTTVVSDSVMENLAPGTFVLSVVARDADPPGRDSKISYAIRGGSGLGYFTINSTGVYTREVLDRETRSEYWLEVVATDSAVVPLHSTLHVYISVTDVNDNFPMSDEPVLEAEVEENCASGTEVTQVKVVDRDGDGPMKFKIVAGNSDKLFRIGRSSGVITTGEGVLDREKQDSHLLQVSVTDWGRPALTSQLLVRVSVKDRNDHTPHFLERYYKPTIVWGPHVVNTELPLFQVLGYDEDAGVNSHLHYSLISSDGSVQCRIDPNTGHVYLTSLKGLTPNSKHQLKATVRDGGSPARASSVPILLTFLPEQLPLDLGGMSVQLASSAAVYESDSVGHLVTTATANTTAVFRISDGNEGEVFSISTEGALVVARRLDREMKDHYQLNISATDGHQTVYTKISISVEDFNDCQPRFDRPAYQVSVPELSPVATQVALLSATDQDLHNDMYYTLEGTESTQSQHLFTIDEFTGRITLLQTLDREVQHEHILTVGVHERGMPSRADWTRLYVHVQDVNEHAPAFDSSGQPVTVFVDESVPVGGQVTRLEAIDRDHGGNGRVRYSLMTGNTGGTFSVDPESGAVLVAAPLNRDLTSEYMLEVRAEDSGTPPLSSPTHVNIIVTESRISIPVFSQKDYSVEVREDTLVGSPLLSVIADSHISPMYSLVAGNSHGIFRINTASGTLYLNQPLDYESQTVHKLTVQATTTGSQTSSARITVHVLDVNDNAPRLEGGIQHVSGRVSELAPEGTLVMSDNGAMVVSAQDPDSHANGQLVYSIKSDHGLLSIDPTTGALRTGGALNYEQQRVLRAMVHVRDSGTPVSLHAPPVHVTVHVLDADDESPRFANENADLSLHVLTPVYGGQIIGHVEAEDPDTPQLTYLIVHCNDGIRTDRATVDCVFTVNSTTGEIRARSKTDTVVELAPFTNLTITASDGVRSAAIAVHVTSAEFSASDHVEADIDEDRVVFEKRRYLVRVTETDERKEFRGRSERKGIVALALRGVHISEQFHFHILTPTSYFEIGITSGVVSLARNAQLDREVQPRHELVVEARSQLTTPRVARAVVRIDVDDVNDVAPRFINLPYYCVVAAGSTGGTPVLAVRAIDADRGENGRVRYMLLSGNPDLFSVNSESGHIKLVRSIGVTPTSHTLLVAAVDNGYLALNSTATVNVSVVLHQQPRFSHTHYSCDVTVTSQLSVGSALLTVHAVAPSGANVAYQLVEPRRSQLFEMDFDTGVLSLRRQLDDLSVKAHSLTVSAIDRVTGSQAAVPVTVNVTGSSASKLTSPTQQSFSLSPLIQRANISESAIVGSGLVQLFEPIKGDVDDNLSFQLQTPDGSTSELFSVQKNGWLQLMDELDYESQQVHKLRLIVSDGAKPGFTAQLSISVIDANDHPPVFTAPLYIGRVSVAANRGQLVTMVTAVDMDVSDQLMYHIVGGDTQQLFTIQADSGIISVQRRLDLSEKSLHVLNVSTSDGVHVAFSMVRIQILAVNKNSPVFARLTYDVQLDESVPAGTVVAKVTATDADPGHFGRVSYSVGSSLWSELFSINSTSGVISTESQLDREAAAVIEVPVTASDPGHRTGHSIVRIRLLDVNDNAPQFDVTRYDVTVTSSVMPGDVLCQVFATDEDAGDNSHVKYSARRHGNSAVDRLDVFDVKADTGEVVLLKPPSELNFGVYEFTVRATDGALYGALWSDVTVRVVVDTSSRLAPKFEAPPYSVTGLFLPEDTAIGAVVTSVRASASATDRVRYSVTSRHADTFSVDRDGQLILIKHLDREQTNRYNVTVTAETVSRPGLVSQRQVTLYVTDVNDVAPRFQMQQYRCLVPFDVEPFTDLVQVVASDEDAGSNGRVQYSLSTQSHHLHALFTVDESSGWVRTMTSLDLETAEYRLTVQATDSGVPRLTASAEVFITVVQNQRCVPRFQRHHHLQVRKEDQYQGHAQKQEIQPLAVQVPEDVSVGTVVASLNTASCGNSSDPAVTFHVISGDQHTHFQMISTGPSSGDLVVYRSLDRETIDQFLLNISATDGVVVISTIVNVEVLDVNDNEPECVSPVYTLRVPEDSPLGPLLTVAVRDRDLPTNSRTLFELEDDRDGMFSVDGVHGQVSLERQLDRESADFHQLTVRARDVSRDHWQCSSRVEIHVLDINDCRPRLRPDLRSLSVAEDTTVGTVLGRLRAIDEDLGDGGEVDFFLADPEGKTLLSVDPVTGVVSLSRPLDRERESEHRVTIRLSDRGTPQLSRTETLRLLVKDVNDNAPEFDRLEYHVTVFENVTADSQLTSVSAWSRDIGINAAVTYRIVDGNLEQKFAINTSTGLIFVQSGLDYERISSYVLKVEAVDGGSPPLTGITTVNITVSDCNDNAPLFNQATYVAIVAENAAVGYQVTQIRAVDNDSGRNARVSYSIVSGDDLSQFEVHSTRGTLFVRSPLDRETRDSYVLQVKAVDGGNPALSALAIVTIRVTDVNDNPPQFERDNYTAYVQETSEVGHQVLQLIASDLDTPTHAGPFHWSLTSSDPRSGDLLVDSDGVVRVAASLSRERVAVYRLVVEVSDSGRPPLTNQVKVTIQIIEEPRFPPVCVPLHVTMFAYEGLSPGASLGRLHVSDQDPHDRLQFTLRSIESAATPSGRFWTWTQLDLNTHRNLFELDSGDGSILALAGLDPAIYRLNISVDDGKFSCNSVATVSVHSVTKAALRCAVSVKLRHTTPRQFVATRWKVFSRTLRKLVHVPLRDIVLLSVQPSVAGNNSYISDGNRHRRSTTTSAAQLLIAVRLQQPSRLAAGTNSVLNKEEVEDGGDDEEVVDWMPAHQLRQRLENSRRYVLKHSGVDMVEFGRQQCVGNDVCGNGVCGERFVLHTSGVTEFSSATTSFVAAPFSHQLSCTCHVGFKGSRCSMLANECGTMPCPISQQCVPIDSPATSSSMGAGFTCRCPRGYAGARCDLTVTPHCQSNPDTCYHPHTPLTFNGSAVLSYRVSDVISPEAIPMTSSARNFSLSLSVRTRQLTGTLMYAHGVTEFHALELENGLVQYRFDCGGGQVRVPLTDIAVNDDRWHNIRVERFDCRAKLLVDGVYSIQGTAPGGFSLLIVESSLLYIGARPLSSITPSAVVQHEPDSAVHHAFVGCLDNVHLQGVRVDVRSPVSPAIRRPTAVKLQTSHHVRAGCRGHDEEGSQVEPGICLHYQPCLNGGSCYDVEVDTSSSNLLEYEKNREVGGSSGRGYRCVCRKGFSGDRCEVHLDPCSGKPCLHDGVCRPFNSTFHCRCRAGLSGARCQHGRYCGAKNGASHVGASTVCQNGGTCEEAGPDGAACLCMSGFTGSHCQLDIDECAVHVSACADGSRCVNTHGAFHCVCPADRTGHQCDRHVSSPEAVSGGRLWRQVIGLAAGLILLLLLSTMAVVAMCCWRRIKHKPPPPQPPSDTTDGRGLGVNGRGQFLSGRGRGGMDNDPASADVLLMHNIKPTELQPNRADCSTTFVNVPNHLMPNTGRGTLGGTRPTSGLLINNLDSRSDTSYPFSVPALPPYPQELMHSPHSSAPQPRTAPAGSLYSQNINKPTASVAPSLLSTMAISASDDNSATYKPMDKCVGPSFFDLHKIQNDSMDQQLLALNSLKLPGMSDSPRVTSGNSRRASTALSSPEMPGYHWDCSDWVEPSCHSPPLNMTEVTASEVKDSTSFRSNESNESCSTARIGSRLGRHETPTFDGASSSQSRHQPPISLADLNSSLYTENIGADAENGEIDALPAPTDFEQILLCNGVCLDTDSMNGGGGGGMMGGSSQPPSVASSTPLTRRLRRLAHPNNYLPTHSQPESPISRFRIPVSHRSLCADSSSELEPLTSSITDIQNICSIDSELDRSTRV